MKCPFNDCPNDEDITEFNDPMEHLIITVGILGHTHIHGPFDNEFILKKMADALIAEMKKHGIEYTLPQPPQSKPPQIGGLHDEQSNS